MRQYSVRDTYKMVIVVGGAGLIVTGSKPELPRSLEESRNHLGEATRVGTAGVLAGVGSKVVERAGVQVFPFVLIKLAVPTVNIDGVEVAVVGGAGPIVTSS